MQQPAMIVFTGDKQVKSIVDRIVANTKKCNRLDISNGAMMARIDAVSPCTTLCALINAIAVAIHVRHFGKAAYDANVQTDVAALVKHACESRERAKKTKKIQAQWVKNSVARANRCAFLVLKMLMHRQITVSIGSRMNTGMRYRAVAGTLTPSIVDGLEYTMEFERQQQPWRYNGKTSIRFRTDNLVKTTASGEVCDTCIACADTYTDTDTDTDNLIHLPPDMHFSKVMANYDNYNYMQALMLSGKLSKRLPKNVMQLIGGYTFK